MDRKVVFHGGRGIFRGRDALGNVLVQVPSQNRQCGFSIERIKPEWLIRIED